MLLAFDLDDSDGYFGADELRVLWQGSDTRRIQQQKGRRVLVFSKSGSVAAIRAVATLVGISLEPARKDQQFLLLRDVEWFEEPVIFALPSRSESNSGSWVSAADFSLISSKGLSKTSSGAAEAPSPTFDFSSLAGKSAQHTSAVCQFTGLSQSWGARDAGVFAVAIRPVDSGSVPQPENTLVLSLSAMIAFEAFHLSVGIKGELVTNLAKIDPELFAHLNPLGFLHLTDGVTLGDMQVNLAWHRNQFFDSLD